MSFDGLLIKSHVQSMSNNFIQMSKLRQILKLYSQSISKQYIAETVGVSRNTVKSYVRTSQALNKSFEELNALSDKELDDLFKRQHTVQHEGELKLLYAFFPEAEKRLARRGTSICDLWKDYASKNPQGLGKTAFYAHYNLYKRRQAPSMHIDHKAGDKIFIDFAGETYPMWIPIPERLNGHRSSRQSWVEAGSLILRL